MDQSNIVDTNGTMLLQGQSTPRVWAPYLLYDNPPFTYTSAGDTFLSSYMPSGPYGSGSC